MYAQYNFIWPPLCSFYIQIFQRFIPCRCNEACRVIPNLFKWFYLKKKCYERMLLKCAYVLCTMKRYFVHASFPI